MVIPSMREVLAKATVLCLSRMSWSAAKLEGEVVELADMPARVENLLKLFCQEPPTVRKMMTTTLRLLAFGIAERLDFAETITRRWERYHATESGIPVTAEKVEDINNSA